MGEGDIKVEVLSWIRRVCRHRDLPVVTGEFSLNGTGIRADLAVLHSGFYGIEIKSAADSLKRLPSQMEGYARYFDRTILVVAPKHLRGLSGLNLQGAQVWSQSALSEQQLRERGMSRRVAGHTLLGLLTAEEERRAVRNMEHATSRTLDPARAEFEDVFRRRYASTSAVFWETVRGRRIRLDDLKLLSRFHFERERDRAARDAETARWAQWVSRMCDAPAP